jgi:hypothetical protein
MSGPRSQAWSDHARVEAARIGQDTILSVVPQTAPDRTGQGLFLLQRK